MTGSAVTITGISKDEFDKLNSSDSKLSEVSSTLMNADG